MVVLHFEHNAQSALDIWTFGEPRPAAGLGKSEHLGMITRGGTIIQDFGTTPEECAQYPCSEVH
jgi:hypothetical protein